MLNFIGVVGRSALGRGARHVPPFKGRTRLLRLGDRVLRRLGPGSFQADISGVKFELDTQDIIDFGLCYSGAYQGDLVRYIVSRLPAKDPIFWDIGGNVGSVSLPVARRAPTARVYSFEPSPPVHRRFAANLKLNPDLQSRVTLNQWALSDSTGEADFFVSNESFNSGVGGLAIAANRTAKPVRVPVFRGDDLLAEGRLPFPNVVKVDVEGFEAAVFRGLKGLLSSSRPFEIIFEHAPYRLRERQAPLDEVTSYLKTFGLTLHTLRQGQTKPFAESDLDRNCDLVARRE